MYRDPKSPPTSVITPHPDYRKPIYGNKIPHWMLIGATPMLEIHPDGTREEFYWDENSNRIPLCHSNH